MPATAIVDRCWGCGLPYRTPITRCEKVCPNCGHRPSCHD